MEVRLYFCINQLLKEVKKEWMELKDSRDAEREEKTHIARRAPMVIVFFQKQTYVVPQ